MYVKYVPKVSTCASALQIQKQYKCIQCGKAFRFKESLQKHMVTHTGDGPYKCKECKRAFINFNSLKIHERVTLERNPMNVYNVEKFFHIKATSKSTKN